ncbi:MAG: hypothetical protein IPM54_11735 [Polyangiaceae bacterium]|nr:hypothetical protein [Polyangiaceae bacterium]
MRALRFLVPTTVLFLATSFFLTNAGCSSGAGGSGASGATGGTGGAGGSGGESTGVTCEGAPAEHDLEGTWAAYGRLAVTLQGQQGGAITICPADQIGESTMLLMVTMNRDPADPTKLVNVDAVLCEIELPVVTALVGQCDPASKSLVSTQIIAPKTLLDALPKIKPAPVGGSLMGADLALDRFLLTVGSTKAGDMMPSWNDVSPTCTATNLGRTNLCETNCVDDCAALRDDDADTYPGVTVNVCGTTPDDVKANVPCNADEPNIPGATLQGRGFIDMEVNPLFTGSAKSSCELEGTVDSEVRYRLVGADIYLAGAQIGVTSAIKSLPAFQVDPAESRFRMVRIDGKYGAPDWKVDPANATASCTTLLARKNEL